MAYYLVFDIDREGAVFAWYDENLPTPLWTSMNPENGHAHIAYRLKIPICTSDIAHIKPIRFLAAIESAMIEKLKSDRGFAGLLTKNPLHPHWQNKVWDKYEYTFRVTHEELEIIDSLVSSSSFSNRGEYLRSVALNHSPADPSTESITLYDVQCGLLNRIEELENKIVSRI